MNGQDDVAELVRRSRLPDPCTLVFGTPIGAPECDDGGGRRWTVSHWVYLAGKAGHHALPTAPTVADREADDRAGAGRPARTHCGDVDLDGVTYQVWRGARQRQLVMYVLDGVERASFQLAESVWVEPLEPEPVPDDCPWCDEGAPAVFRAAAAVTDGTGRLVSLGEHPDGTGRVLTVMAALTADDTYCLVLDPGHHTSDGEIRECVLAGRDLRLVLTAAAADDLGVPPELRFGLDLDDARLDEVRDGLREALGSGRPEARPTRLEV